MGKLFNLDSPFMQFMNRMADIVIINMLMLLCSLPVVTIGASVTATYYMTLKMVRDEETYIVKGFFKSFKQNFVQATIIWLITLLFGAVFVIDYLIITGRIGEGIINGTVTGVMTILLIMILVLYLFMLTFVFPLLAKFDNSVKNTIKNAFLISVRHFPTTLICIVITIVAVVVIYYFDFIKLLCFFGFIALISYTKSYLLVRVFDKYIPKDQEEISTEEVLEQGEMGD